MFRNTRQKRRARRISRSQRPFGVESLEDKTLLTASISLGIDGVLSIDGDDSANRIVVNELANSVTVRADDTVESFNKSDVNSITIHGRGGDDFIRMPKSSLIRAKLFGDDGNDNVRGGGANDFIDGGRGRDRLFGFGGNDRILGRHGDDIIRGGTGDDWEHGHGGRDRLFGEDGHDEEHGGAGDDVLFGNAGDDSLYGERGRDRVDGHDGDDFIDGGDDDDFLFGRNGIDRIRGGRGDDYVRGGAGDDDLFGDHGRDRIFGDDGIDDVYTDRDDDHHDDGHDRDHGVGSHDNSVNIYARLTGPGGIRGEAEFEQETEHGATKLKLDVKVYNASPNTTYPVTVDNVVVGNITTDAFGRGKIEFSTRPDDHDLPYPTGLGALSNGVVVQVGNDITGTF